MSEHNEHFTPSAGGPVWEPDPRCPTCMGHELPAPINWPDRFRRAAEVLRQDGWGNYAALFSHLADGTPKCEVPADVVAAVGRALLGEGS